MINIMIPCCGTAEFFKGSYYPKTLYEISGKPMFQHVIENYRDIEDKRFIFLFLQEECNKFHTDNVARLLTEGTTSDIIVLRKSTGGALCTCLMAVDYIDNDDPLVIANGDQLITADLDRILKGFLEEQYDGGVICFENYHPRWSYVRIAHEKVVEVVEKCPISRDAVAGFYYYRHGRDFVEAAKNAILKDSNYDGRYYLSASVNEMILQNKYIGYRRIDSTDYKSFYSPEKIREFEKEGVTDNED